MEKKAILIFVRNDLTYTQKVVQAAHAAKEAARAFIDHQDGDRYKIVVLAAKSEAKLKAIQKEAEEHGIKTVTFTEPDMEYQATALATEPLDSDKRGIFSRYKLLQE